MSYLFILYISTYLFKAFTSAAHTQPISHVSPPPSLSLSLCGHHTVHQSPISILPAQASWAVWVQRPQVGEHVPGFGLNVGLIIELSSDLWCHFPHIIRATVGLEAKLSTLTHTHTQEPVPFICICWRHTIDPSISTTYYLVKSSLRKDSSCNFASVRDEEGQRHFGRFGRICTQLNLTLLCTLHYALAHCVGRS